MKRRERELRIRLISAARGVRDAKATEDPLAKLRYVWEAFYHLRRAKVLIDDPKQKRRP